MKKFTILLVITTVLCSTAVWADDLESNRYRIQFSNVNIGAGTANSSSYKVNTSIGQTVAGKFDSSGYTIKAGFQYLYSIIRFRFTVSNSNISFGNVISQQFYTGSTNLTVNFGNPGQYQVTAIEETKMKTLANDVIPDTACNSGTTCTIGSANVWTNTSRYGFGYNMSGNDIPADFLGATYYRPFPDRSNSDSPVVVMTSSQVAKNRQSTMTFKLNISPLQAPGNYQTIINYVATPSY
jgi:hypothetical protein